MSTEHFDKGVFHKPLLRRALDFGTKMTGSDFFSLCKCVCYPQVKCEISLTV